MPCLPIVCLDGITRRFELTDHGEIFERRFSAALANVRIVDHYEEGDADQGRRYGFVCGRNQR